MLSNQTLNQQKAFFIIALIWLYELDMQFFTDMHLEVLHD